MSLSGRCRNIWRRSPRRTSAPPGVEGPGAWCPDDQTILWARAGEGRTRNRCMNVRVQSGLLSFPLSFLHLTPLLFFPSYFCLHEGEGQCSSARIEGCLLVAAGRDWSTPGEARALQAELPAEHLGRLGLRLGPPSCLLSAQLSRGWDSRDQGGRDPGQGGRNSAQGGEPR